MKKLCIFATTLFLTVANAFAMDENQENYQDPKHIVMKSVEEEHTAFAAKITKHLNKVENALEANALESSYNTKINLTAAYGNFNRWLDFFDSSAKEDSKEFVRPLRKLFVEFKEILNNEKISGTEDYPAPIRHVFALNLRIQKLVDEYSN